MLKTAFTANARFNLLRTSRRLRLFRIMNSSIDSRFFPFAPRHSLYQLKLAMIVMAQNPYASLQCSSTYLQSRLFTIFNIYYNCNSSALQQITETSNLWQSCWSISSTKMCVQSFCAVDGVGEGTGSIMRVGRKGVGHLTVLQKEMHSGPTLEEQHEDRSQYGQYTPKHSLPQFCDVELKNRHRNGFQYLLADWRLHKMINNKVYNICNTSTWIWFVW